MSMSKAAYWWNNANKSQLVSVIANALGGSKIHELSDGYFNLKWSELNKADKRHIEAWYESSRFA